MGHNIWFCICLLVLVILAPLGSINPIFALVSVILSGIFFMIWYFKEMKFQEKEYKRIDENEKC